MSFYKRTTTLFLAAAFTLVHAAPRQPNVDITELSLEQLMFNFKVQSVYGASKHYQKLSEAPSSVTIVDAEEIALFGHRSFADVLKSVRSLYVTNDRNYNYIGVRGFDRPGDYSSRVLVLVNGHRVNENVLDSVLIGYEFPLDVDLIQRVEVIRGPSSSIYGNNAFFGVINVITKDAAALDGLTLSSSYGSFDTHKTRLTFGKAFQNGLQLSMSASYYDSAGPGSLYFPEYDTDENRVNNGLAQGADDERFYKTFASVSYRNFTVEASLASRLKGIPTGSYGTILNDSSAETTDRFAWVDFKYNREFGEDWQFSARGSYDSYHYDGTYPHLDDAGGRVLYSDSADGVAVSGDLHLSRRFKERHTFALGVETRHNLKQDQASRDDDTPFAPAYHDHRSSRSNGVYGQAEISLTKNLLVNSGIRWDHFGTFGTTTNPRLAVIYNPSDTTTLKALYGTAFKAPNAYELFYSSPSNKGNPSLKPETIDTYELVLEQSLSSQLTFLASAFSYEIRDLVNQTLDPADDLLVYTNSDRVTARGLEMELNGNFQGRVRTRLSYTYQRTKDEFTQRELSNSPRHLAKANVSIPLWGDKLASSIEVFYSSRAGTLAGRHAPEHCISNLTLFSRKLLKGCDASLSIYNLFDTKYSHPGAGEHLQDVIRQDGRTFRAKLTYRF